MTAVMELGVRTAFMHRTREPKNVKENDGKRIFHR